MCGSGLPVILNCRFSRIRGLTRKARVLALGLLLAVAVEHVDFMQLLFVVDFSLQLVSQMMDARSTAEWEEEVKTMEVPEISGIEVESWDMRSCSGLYGLPFCLDTVAKPSLLLTETGTTPLDCDAVALAMAFALVMVVVAAAAAAAAVLVDDDAVTVAGIQFKSHSISSSNESSSHDDADVCPPSTSSNDKSKTFDLLESLYRLDRSCSSS